MRRWLSFRRGFRRESVGRMLDGFGFLVPRAEGLRVLGCVWNSSLFPGRAPEGHVLLTSFAGGAMNPEMCTWGEERIASAVHEDLERVLNINEEPIARHVHVYQRAIPQYNLGHGRILDRKSTRLNSSHLVISYAVFCLKKK